MCNWKAFAALAVGAALIAAPAPAAYLPPHGSGGAAPAKKVTVEIDGDAVILNGQKFNLPIEEKELFAIWGKPDRVADLSNRISTWDNLGIYIYARPKQTKSHAMAFAFGKFDTSFWPKKSFAGTLSLDGAEVVAKSTIAGLGKAKRGNPFEKSLLQDTWKVVNKRTSVYVRHRPDPADGLIDVEVGIDPDAKGLSPEEPR
jgi:hypothetical protein